MREFGRLIWILVECDSHSTEHLILLKLLLTYHIDDTEMLRVDGLDRTPQKIGKYNQMLRSFLMRFLGCLHLWQRFQKLRPS